LTVEALSQAKAHSWNI